MQKKLLALAIAGVISGGAYAQSNVTISGQVRMSVNQYKLSNVGAAFAASAENHVTDESSRLFIRGKEDLGGGGYASFQIENRFSPDLGAFSAGGNTNLTLGGNWGSLAVGRQDLHYGTALESYLAFTNQNFLGNGPLSQVNGTVIALASRTANSVWYDSPNMSGFTLRVAGSTAFAGAEGSGVRAAGAADPGKGGATNLALNYANGPIKAGYSYWNATVEGGKTALVGDQRGDTLQFGYSFPMGLSLGIAWNKSKLDFTTGERSRTAWLLPISYDFGANRVNFTYLSAGDTTGVANSGAKAFTLAFGHSLSKRTSVGINYSKLTNEAGATYNLFGGGTSTAATPGADVSQVALTVYHSF
jgi:predicted porin